MPESVETKAPNSKKKQYEPPKLTEYGTVAKLTQGNGSLTAADGASGMVMPR